MQLFFCGSSLISHCCSSKLRAKDGVVSMLHVAYGQCLIAHHLWRKHLARKGKGALSKEVRVLVLPVHPVGA